MVEHHADQSDSSNNGNKTALWTVIGSIAASVLATALIGGATGILQISTIARDQTAIEVRLHVMEDKVQAFSDRLRNVELIVEVSAKKQEDLKALFAGVEMKRDLQADKTAAFEQMYTREHAALEGRSKDRNTEVVGLVMALRNDYNGLRDRVDTQNGSILGLRSMTFELARTVQYRPGSPPVSVTPQLSPDPPHTPDPNSTDPRYFENIRKETNRNGFEQLRRRDQVGHGTEVQGSPEQDRYPDSFRR